MNHKVIFSFYQKSVLDIQCSNDATCCDNATAACTKDVFDIAESVLGVQLPIKLLCVPINRGNTVYDEK